MNDLRNIDNNLRAFRNENITNNLLYGNQIYDDKTNQLTLMDVSQYIKDSKIFDELPFNPS